VGLVAAVAVLVAAYGVFPRSSPLPSPTHAAVVSGAPGASPSVAGRSPSSPPPSVSSSPGSSGPESFPTDEEAELLGRLPPDVRNSNCQRSSLPDGSLGGFLSIRCDLLLGADADTVWWDKFGTTAQAGVALSTLSEREALADGTCSTDVPSAQGSWRLGFTFSGKLLCYQGDAGAWIIWSYDGQDLVARAVRRDGDWQALYDWWEATAYFLE
jgi:hypothetical protein